MKRKRRRQLCACGCGGYAKPENKYIHGHQCKGKDKYAEEKTKQPPLCACGCGERVKWCNGKKRWNTYMNGHYCNGRKCPEQSERMKDKNHPIRSLESRAKTLGKNHWAYGKKRLDIAERMRGKNNPSYGKMGEAHPCSGIDRFQSNNPNWKGGISQEVYCLVWQDLTFKNDVKKRDGNVCMNPDCRNNCGHLPLDLHHINYVKKDCRPSNLITLCRSCNARANGNREEHTEFYQNIMTEKHGYTYCKSKGGNFEA